MWGHYTVYWAPDGYNPDGHPLIYAIRNELGKLGSSRRVVNDNGGGVFGVVRLSFEIPLEWLEEAVNANSVPDNFQKINLRTRQFPEKAVPKGQLIMNIASPEVIRVEEMQMSEVTQSWTGCY